MEFDFRDFMSGILKQNEHEKYDPQREQKVISFAQVRYDRHERAVNDNSVQVIVENGYMFAINFYGVVDMLPKGHHKATPNCIDPAYTNCIYKHESGVREWYIIRDYEA